MLSSTSNAWILRTFFKIEIDLLLQLKMDCDNELIEIIDKTNVDKATATPTTTRNCYRPKLSMASSPIAETASHTVSIMVTTPTATQRPMTPTSIPNLIDFDDCQQFTHTKLSKTSSFDEISLQHVCTWCLKPSILICLFVCVALSHFDFAFLMGFFYLLFSKNSSLKMVRWRKEFTIWNDKKRDLKRYGR